MLSQEKAKTRSISCCLGQQHELSGQINAYFDITTLPGIFKKLYLQAAFEHVEHEMVLLAVTVLAFKQCTTLTIIA